MTPTPQQTAEAVKEIQERIDKGCFYEHDKPTFQTLLLALSSAQEERDCWLFNAKELQKQVNQMEKEIEELKRDKERLDWLNDFQTGNYETPYWKIYQVNPGQDLREAIDSAMQPTTKRE